MAEGFWVDIYEPNGKKYLGGSHDTLESARKWAKEWIAERPGFTATINDKMYRPRKAV